MTDFEDNPDVAAAAAISAGPVLHEEPVLILSVATTEEAEVARATLEAAGVPAMLSGTAVNPYLGAVDGTVDEIWLQGIFVAPANVEAARAILSSPQPTEAELIAEEEADSTTLEEAEARANEA